MQKRQDSSSVPRRRAMMLRGSRSLLGVFALLCMLLAGGQTARAWTHSPSLELTSANTQTLDDNTHVSLLWYFFNYDGNDNGYEGDVYLTIDGVDVCKLNDAYGYCTNNRDSEDRVKGKKSQGNYGDAKSFTFGTGNSGIVRFHDQWEGDNKWIKIRLNVILQQNYYGVARKIGIRGYWRDKNKSGGNSHLQVSLNAPNVTFPTINIARTGNRTAKVGDIALATDSREIKGTTYYWRYAFDFYKASKTNGNYYAWNANDCFKQTSVTGASKNGDYHSDAELNSNSATINLDVDNNKPVTIYPRVSRWSSPNYSVYATSGAASMSGIVQFFRYYDGITLKGYPYPDSISVTNYDKFSKEVAIKWVSNCYNKDWAKTNTNGKWIIFREVAGKPATRVKLGEASYNVTSYSDTSDKVYGTKYTYTVCFQPTEWNTSINSPAEADGLTTDVTQLVDVDNTVFNTFTASNDLEGKIKVDFTTISFTDATAAKPYTIYLFRGERDAKGNTVWESEAISTYKVSDKNTTSFTYTDTKIDNKYQVFEYMVQVSAQETTYIKKDVTGKAAGDTKISNVTASRGSFQGSVIVNWTSVRLGSDDTYYELKRRPLGTNASWQTIYTVASTATSFSYEDKTAQPGSYYEYMVDMYEYYQGNKQPGVGKATDGFSLATGVINGRVYYDTGTAVDGVKVMLRQNSDDETKSSFRSFDIGSSTTSGIYYPADNQEISELFNGDFTIQMWVNPRSGKMINNSFRYMLFDVPSIYTVWLQDADGQGNSFYVNVWSGANLGSGITIPADQWSFLTFSYTKATNTTSVYVGQKPENIKQKNIVRAHGTNTEATTMYLGNIKDYIEGKGQNGNAKNYIGKVDEFRFFTKALTQKQVERNMTHRLSGSEDGLAIYYPMDEGINGQSIIYDYSKTQGLANGRHATVSAASVSADVPSEDLFSLCSFTDENGNYSITGVPFNGDGTAYSVCPVYGEHEFSPNKLNRFVSASSLIADGVDFKDVSSFKVKGIVYYDGTTYPVGDVQFAVDGVTCTKDNAIIKTLSGDDGDMKAGEFEISVPIGYHYITASLNGHTFLNEGRYPANPDANSNKLHEFTKNMTGLKFYDTTLVPVTGRVTGGPTEYAKPLGLGQSSNNIGTAVIELQASDTYRMNVLKNDDEASSEFVYNPSAKSYDAPEDYKANYKYFEKDVKSTAVVGGGSDAATRVITVTTDPNTGEWAAMLPPVPYTVNKIYLKNNPDASLLGDTDTKFIIDPSNVIATTTDSIVIKGEKSDITKKFTYNAAWNLEYRVTPTMTISQEPTKQVAFGEKIFSVKNDAGTLVSQELFNDKGDFSVVPNKSKSITNDAYTYGYPVFYQGSSYDFFIDIYEQYENADKAATALDKYSKVPLSDVVVTIGNEMGTGNTIILQASETEKDEEGNSLSDGDIIELAPNQVQTDADGKAKYTWTAGMPNIQNDFTRTMTVTYDVNGTQLSWVNSGMTGIVFGNLPTGNNFMSSGPDKVVMILRDPAGTGSSSFIEEGYTVSKEVETGIKITSENEISTETHFGTDVQQIVGLLTPAGSITAVETEAKSSSSLEVGLNVNIESSLSGVTTEEVTTTKRVSTSDGSDFVGAVGDVFIGTATNYIFGKAREVGLHLNATQDGFDLDMKQTYKMGTSFGTEFHYTLNYVENVLIPNFQDRRNSMIIPIDDYANIPVNSTEKPKYYSTVDPDDEVYFGSNNTDRIWGAKATKSNHNFSEYKKGVFKSPSYVMILPADFETNPDKYAAFDDSVAWCNAQIASWENTLMENEKAKVTAIENRSKWLEHNYSFDAGAGIEGSITTSNSEQYSNENELTTTVVAGFGTDVEIAGTGVDISVKTTTGSVEVYNSSETTSNEKTVGYALVEDGDDDALTVDVYRAPDGFGPIFYTQAGQTCCPYEDEVRTKYYRPGTIISQKTMQIEQPHITAAQTSITGVPVGGAANFTIYLSNTSETDEDCFFNIQVASASNPDGAAVTMDGTDLNYGHTVLVKAGQEMRKTVQISQTNTDITEFRDIELRLFSTCQSDNTGVFPEVADTVKLSAFFQHMSSDIAMTSQESALNIASGSSLHTTIKGYDINSTGLVGVRFQAQMDGDVSWTTVKEWRKGASKDPLDENGSFEYVFNMSNSQTYADGNWKVRAVTFSNFGGEEAITPSEIISFSKDMSRPQLITAATPTNGILSADSEISLTFNEDIRSAAIAKADNFKVNGELNDAKVKHTVAMNLTGADGAKTAASINLADNSFAVNMWVKYSAAGSIFTHGAKDNSFDLSVNDEGKLVVTVGGKSYTSDKSILKDKWQFLSFAYDADSKSVYADYAEGASSVNIFNNQAVGEYTGNGSLTFGQGLTGQMHEITLWNNARAWADAQSQMYTKKTRYSDGLIGYWRLDEGHGSSATDYSRSRTLALPGENAWFLAGENYALTLDGTQAAAIACGAVSTDQEESYTMELWFQADKTQAGNANIIGFNKVNTLDIYLDEAGKMKMNALGTTYDVSNTDYRDGQWHHLALNALKSTNGIATVYVDGNSMKSVSASAVPAIQTSKIIIGGHKATSGYDQPLKGAVDEIRIWNGRRTSDVILNNMYARVDEKADGLMAYYPFEIITLDEGDQATTVTTFNDVTKNEKSKIAKILGENSLASTSANTPALKTAPTLQNVNFTFVTSERKLLIKLDEDAERLENCVVHLTVKGVRDTHNNECEPISWDVLVRQNQLLWTENDIEVRKEGTEAASFTVSFENNGATAQSWTLSGMPTWLSANTESGSLNGSSDRKITFTVDPSLAIGNYEATVYLTGALGIAEPLVVSVVSAGDAPMWTPTLGQSTMTVLGQIKIDDKTSTDSEDMVGAFRGQECVGVAQPKYFPEYDAYYVLMSIYGDEDSDGSALTYKVYDASTGQIYPSVGVSVESVKAFLVDATAGSYTSPVIFSPEDKIEQDLSTDRAGWAWMSYYVDPADLTAAQIYADAKGGVAAINSSNQSIVYDSGSWLGNLNAFNTKTMYKVKANGAFTESLIGKPAATATTDITLNAGWTWIGYPATATNSLNAAFADADPQSGDLVKSQSQFAIYNGAAWEGTLTAMTPGVGYNYFSNASAAKTFHYAVPTTTNRKNAPKRIAANVSSTLELSTLDNMTMVAEVLDGAATVSDAEVRVYAGSELRGLSVETIDGRHYITIGGNAENEVLTVIVRVDDVDYKLAEGIKFGADAMLGTVALPYELQINGATPVADIYTDADIASVKYYDASGRSILKSAALANGVYLKTVTYKDGHKETLRCISK